MSEQEGSERSVSLSQPLSSFHQGGEGLATRGHVLEDEPSLASSLASLVTKQKLGAPSPLQGLWKQQMTDLFSKRKRRWRKRHGREEPVQVIGDRLAEEKERLEEVVANKGYLLVERRDRGLEDAINLEASENFHCLGVFISRVNNEGNAMQHYLNERAAARRELTTQSLSYNPDHLSLIRDLEATLSQAEALAEVRKMKLAMTPRVPQLQDRTLSGDILEQSLRVLQDGHSLGGLQDNQPLEVLQDGMLDEQTLGVLQDSLLDISNIPVELFDSEHAHLQIIGNEVSISSAEVHQAEEDGCIVNRGSVSCDDPSAEEPGRGVVEGGGDEEAARELVSGGSEVEVVVNTMPEETPGVGMEVVCSEGCEESSMLVSVQSTVLPPNKDSDGHHNSLSPSNNSDHHHNSLSTIEDSDDHNSLSDHLSTVKDSVGHQNSLSDHLSTVKDSDGHQNSLSDHLSTVKDSDGHQNSLSTSDGHQNSLSPNKDSDDHHSMVKDLPNGFQVALPVSESLSQPHGSSSPSTAALGEEINHLMSKTLGGDDADSDWEGDLHHRILHLFQEARYDLRFPVQRYSNQASQAGRKRRSTVGKSEKESQAASGSKPLRKKRGRPRKHPLPSPSKAVDSSVASRTLDSSCSMEGSSASPDDSATPITSLEKDSIQASTSSSLTAGLRRPLIPALAADSRVPQVSAERSSPMLVTLLRQSEDDPRTSGSNGGSNSGSNGMEWRAVSLAALEGGGAAGLDLVHTPPSSGHSFPSLNSTSGKSIPSAPNPQDLSLTPHLPPKNDLTLPNLGTPPTSRKRGRPRKYPRHDGPT